jgi:hypothetical protein
MTNLNQNNTYPIAPFLRSGFRVFFIERGLGLDYELKNKSDLLTFGNLLKSHFRLEYRHLFPKVDLLSDSEKLAIIKPSSCHTLVVRI